MVDTGARRVAASVDVIAPAAVNGCAGGAGSGVVDEGAAPKKEETAFSSGQAGPRQESTVQRSSGAAERSDRPGCDTGKSFSEGQSEKVRTAFLVPAGQQPAAVEVTRGLCRRPLELPVAS